jgi:hypothetical protein
MEDCNVSLSRRSLVASAAALPALAVPAVASIEPDPIYAAIEAHKSVYARWSIALGAADFRPEDREKLPPGEYKRLQEIASDLSDQHWAAELNLFSSPRTLAGLAALLAYLRMDEYLSVALYRFGDNEATIRLGACVERVVCDVLGLPTPPLYVNPDGDDEA